MQAKLWFDISWKKRKPEKILWGEASFVFFIFFSASSLSSINMISHPSLPLQQQLQLLNLKLSLFSLSHSSVVIVCESIVHDPAKVRSFCFDLLKFLTFLFVCFSQFSIV